MAQGDIFSQFFGAGQEFDIKLGGIINHQKKYNELLTDALERESSILETKKRISKGDYEGYNLLKKIKSTSKSIYASMKTTKQMKNELKIQHDVVKNLEKQYSLTQNLSAEEDKMYQDMIHGKKTELFSSKVIYDQTKRSLPLLGRYGATIATIGTGLSHGADLFGDIFGFVGDVLGGLLKIGKTIFNFFYSPINKVFSLFLEMQSVVGNLAADIGLTAGESRTLLNNMAGLAIEASKFGGDMKDVAIIFDEFSNVTGKNRFFGKDEVAGLMELGLGTGLGVKGAAALASSFDNMGISLQKTVKLTDQARNMAARYNVNTTKVLQTYNELVVSLTGIGFGKGLENLTQLAAKAEAIRFDLVKSTKAFTDAFFDPEKAVEASAQLQVLGGQFAASFGDPMALAFESMNNPTALAEKFANLVKNVVTKDSAGNYIIPPAARKQLQLASESLGQDYEMIKNSAIEQAKITDKMEALSKAGFSLFNIDPKDKPALASLMNLDKNNQFTIKLPNGTVKLLSELTNKDQLKSILDDRQKNEEAAIQRKTLTERLSLIVERFMLGFSKVFVNFNNVLEDGKLIKTIEDFGTSMAEKVIPLMDKLFGDGDGIKKMFTNIIDKVGTITETIGKIWDGDAKFFDKIKETIGKLIAGVWDLVIPYLKAGMGQLLVSIGDATGFDTVKTWGSKMLLEASQQNKTIESMINQGQKNDMINTINSNKSNLSGTQALGVGAGAYGGMLAGAFTGGLMGSEVPIIGNIVGALIGAGLAYWGEKSYNQMNTPDLPTTNVKDALITSHGIVKGDKGDIWAAFQPGTNPMASAEGGTQRVEHSGTIRIESSDGKSVTWDQMYHARDMVGASINSVNQGYNGGFGNYQNPNILPIKPLI